ncbi:MAG: serralysin [Paracoccaceae bacterium]|jgi:serralysin
MHEIGHAMGLEHSQEVGTFGIVPTAYDAMEYTIMSYRSYIGASGVGGYENETWGFAQSYMMLDIAAFQHMYGADFNSNSGNTIYSWSPTSGTTSIDGVAAITPGANRIFATIWDGGGIDTYDLSAYASDLMIDLAPGGFSLFSSTQQAVLGGTTNKAQGNIYNALQFNNDARSLIENATGGSGNDSISGNVAANTLKGNGGNDHLYGMNGKDLLVGGSGRDYLNGGGQNDKLKGGSSNDKLLGGGKSDILLGEKGNDKLVGQGGNDTLNGGGGKDLLTGGAGKDMLRGGAGNDTFRFLAASDSNTGSASDIIKDFSKGADKIDLSALTSTPFIFSNNLTASGPSVTTVNAAGDTRVLVDVNGDGAADMRIIVDNVLGLTASDFIL